MVGQQRLSGRTAGPQRLSGRTVGQQRLSGRTAGPQRLSGGPAGPQRLSGRTAGPRHLTPPPPHLSDRTHPPAAISALSKARRTARPHWLPRRPAPRADFRTDGAECRSPGRSAARGAAAFHLRRPPPPSGPPARRTARPGTGFARRRRSPPPHRRTPAADRWPGAARRGSYPPCTAGFSHRAQTAASSSPAYARCALRSRKGPLPPGCPGRSWKMPPDSSFPLKTGASRPRKSQNPPTFS